MSAMLYKEIAHFERLLTTWGFGHMVGDLFAYYEGREKLNRFLLQHISGEEYDDYCFADEHAGDYQTYLEDMEQDEKYRMEEAKALYEERRWGKTALTF